MVFYEGDNFDFTPGVTWLPIEMVDGLKEFMSKLFPIMTGNLGGRYDINLDARMCRKVFIECHAVKTFGGKVFWLDADSITHSKVPNTFLDEMLPDDMFNCHLGRDGWYYTESGFIGFNADHPLCAKFMKAYRGIAESGVVFTLGGWHDCFTFDAARQLANKPGYFKNLAEGLPHGTMHPFVNSRLGAYMDHRKGPRKESRSTRKDLVIERTEPYWTEQDSGA